MPQSDKSALLEMLNRRGESELARKVQDSITPSSTNRLYENSSIIPGIKKSPVIEKPQGALSDEELIQIGRKKAPEMSRFLPKLLQGPPTQFPPFEPVEQPIDLLRGPKATLSGMVGTVEGMAGGLEWLTGGRMGQDLTNQARGWQKSLQPADPTFLDAVNSGFGSAATFFVPGFGLGFGTAKLASISTKLAMWLGSGVSAGLEAMTEAGMVYRNVLEETGEVQKANDAASFAFWLNLPLVAISNKLGIFGEQNSLIRRGLSSALAEGSQETLQEAISKTAEQKPITAGGLATAGGVGAITGSVIGGATGLAFPQTTITPTEKIEKVTPTPLTPLTPLDIKPPTPPPAPTITETIKEGEGITQEAGETLEIIEKNEGIEARNFVETLNKKGIETIETHRKEDSLSVRIVPETISDENLQKILNVSEELPEEFKNIRFKEYPQPKGFMPWQAIEIHKRPGETLTDAVKKAITFINEQMATPKAGEVSQDRIFYHGTKASIRNIMEASPLNYGNPLALYGQGLYLTDNPIVAEGYATTKGKGKKGIVLPATLKEINVLNLEETLPEEVSNIFKAELERLGDTEPIQGLQGKKVFKKLQDAIEYEEKTVDAGAEIIDTVQYNLEQLGYDGFSYKGGELVGKGKVPSHNVLVLFDIGGKPLQEKIEAGEAPQAPAKEKKLTIQQDIDKLIQEGASPEVFEGPLTIFDKLKEKGVERIAVTQALRDHLDPEEIKAIAKKQIGIFSKEVTALARPFDEVAATMGMTVDDLAEALRTAKTRRQALDDIKRQIEIQKEGINPPVKVSELELEPGDKFQIGGEDYKVTNKEGEVLTIKNKETFKVTPADEIPSPDIGSIDYAGTEFPPPEQPKGAEGETDFYAGIPVKKLLEPFRWKSKRVDDTINLPEELKFSDPEVETAYNDAKYEAPSIFTKGLNWLIKAKESFQRKYTALDPQQDGVVSNILRVFEANPAISKAETAFILKNFTDGFGKKKMELFKRYIFLADIVQDIKEGLVGKDPDAPLRFKFKSIEQIQQEFEKYKKILEANPDVKNAIERRTEFMKALAQKQVDLDLLPEKVLGDGNYYHHQVLQYMGQKAYPGLSAADIRLKRKGYQIARGSSELDYNTDYLESEFEVVSQSLAQIRTVDTLQRLKQFDITNKLKRQAKEQGVENWESLRPDDYTFWQPKKGNVFYPALSISEKAAQEVIEGTSELTEEDLKQIYAVGKKKAQWVIPKRYAETFDDLGRFTQEGPLANISAQTLTSWKQWKLLNPLRAAKYMLNNLSGDLDIVIAYDYHILKHVPEAFREITAFSQAVGMSESVKEFFQEGGLESGITIHEIPDISELGYFKLIAGEKPNLINRYWDTVKGFNNFRENLLRLAAYKHFKQNLLDGKVLYGASRKAEIDAMMSSEQPVTSIAARLARELIGDYGNISHSGNWIRRHMVAFYSWMEINLPRYVRIAENLSAENRAGGKSRAAGAFVAGRFVKFAFFAGFLYSAVELWNRSAWKVIPGFPSPEELTDWQRKQHHIILGRRDDGSIRTIRFQGALGDALSWFGLEDLIRDVEELYEGGYETLKDKGKEFALAPIEKIVQGSRPLLKTGGEALLGKTLYPDITKPRPIRDPWEHALRLIDANKPYRYIKGLPMRGLKDDIESFIFYISDPGESHYYNVKNYVRNYLDKKGIETPSVEPTKKSNALYYHKQALRYGEKEKAQEFWEEYKRLGGTVEGKEQSIRMAHPLYGVKSISEFRASLTIEQRKEIEEAEKWYRKVYFERSAPKKEQERHQALVPTIQ